MSEAELKARAKAIGAEQRVGFVSPDIPLLSNLSVYDNISLIPRYLTAEKDEIIRAEIEKLLALLEISDSIDTCLELPKHPEILVVLNILIFYSFIVYYSVNI